MSARVRLNPPAIANLAAGSRRRRSIVLFRFDVIDPFIDRQRVGVIWPEPTPQVRQHVPELLLRTGVIPAHRQMMGDAKPGGSEVVPYCPVAALNFTTSSAGTRPRSLTSMP